MRAWVLEEFGGPLLLRDVPVPTIVPHEVLVRVRNVGICGTDPQGVVRRVEESSLVQRGTSL